MILIFLCPKEQWKFGLRNSKIKLSCSQEEFNVVQLLRSDSKTQIRSSVKIDNTFRLMENLHRNYVVSNCCENVFTSNSANRCFLVHDILNKIPSAKELHVTLQARKQFEEPVPKCKLENETCTLPHESTIFERKGSFKKARDSEHHIRIFQQRITRLLVRSPISEIDLITFHAMSVIHTYLLITLLHTSQMINSVSHYRFHTYPTHYHMTVIHYHI